MVGCLSVQLHVWSFCVLVVWRLVLHPCMTEKEEGAWSSGHAIYYLCLFLSLLSGFDCICAFVLLHAGGALYDVYEYPTDSMLARVLHECIYRLFGNESWLFLPGKNDRH